MKTAKEVGSIERVRELVIELRDEKSISACLRLELAAAQKTAEDWELLARHQGETLARHAAEDRSAPEMLAALKRIAIEATTGVDPLVLAQTAYAAVNKAEGK